MTAAIDTPYRTAATRGIPGARALAALLAGTLLSGAAAPAAPGQFATLIVRDGAVWTGDPAQPTAQAVAIVDDRIMAVGADAAVARWRGPGTRVIDAHGGTVMPGFIDAHTHFENATQWEFHVGLDDASDSAAIAARIAERTRRIPKGMWIVGGTWDQQASRRAGAAARYTTPDLATIDAVTPDHPVLIERVDGARFINSVGLRDLQLSDLTPNPPGGEYQRDAAGHLTGLLIGTAASRTASQLPPVSRAATLVGARLAQEDLSRCGITSIHDISRIDAISQTMILHSAVERSYSDETIFEDMRRAGDLKVRVYPMLSALDAPQLAAHGITPGSGDDMIHFGALKMFIDGALMLAPFGNNPPYARNFAGNYAFRVTDAADLRRQVIEGDARGYDMVVHVMGDRAHRELLDWDEAAIRINGPRERRFRLIHAMYPAMREIERAGRLGFMADVTPQQYFDERDHLEGKLGPDRIRTAFAWQTLIRAGLRVDLVSDWPASFAESRPMPLCPLEIMYGAVTRRPPGGTPATPAQAAEALTLEQAMTAYTVNPAYAEWRENRKGSLVPGKLADLVILSRDIRRGPPETLLATRVRYTILGGRTVYRDADAR